LTDSDAINAAYATELGTLFSSLFVNSTGEGGLPVFIQKFSSDHKLLQAARDAALAIVTAHEENKKRAD
jgi:hypothetical protein